MKAHVRVAAVLALGTLALAVTSLYADDDAKAVNKDVDRIIEALEKGDAKKVAGEVAKKYEELEPIMHLFALRSKGGRGVGKKAGNAEPDGIEAKLIKGTTALIKKPLASKILEKESEALQDMGKACQAIAEICLAKGPAKDKQNKKKNWDEYSKQMADAGAELARAAKAKNADAVKTAATKLNNSCTSCHGEFRGE